MRIRFLDGPALARELPRLVSSCNQLDVAMAYVKANGLKTLMKNVDGLLTRGGSLRMVFGLSSRQGITDKKSATSLLELSRHRKTEVKKWNWAGFHPKLLIFHGDHPCIVVGSANLTGAAQSRNAEANLLVKDVDQRLMRDALAFFEYYFGQAPVLRKKDVDAYESHTHIEGRTSKRTFQEDEFPSPASTRRELTLLKPNRVWKISPGEDAEYWPEWLDQIDENGEGVVAMGWNHVGSLQKFKSPDMLRRVVKQKAKTVWDVGAKQKTNVGYATNQLWTFKKNISKGDVFIVYSETRVFGLAEVTSRSRYQYQKVKELSQKHQLNVRYRWYNAWPKRADDRIIGTLGKQGTLKHVEEKGFWGHLLEQLP